MLRRLLAKMLAGVLACAIGGYTLFGVAWNAISIVSGSADTEMTYEETLFDTSYVHRIDVHVDDEDWDDLLENPMDKSKYPATVVIDGEEVTKVSFQTKGNSSLTFVAADPECTRYSFKLKFGKYVDGQTYHGLDALSLNNNMADATCIKDYLSYEIFRQAGVPAPLASFVWLTVNGKAQGLYTAVEDMGTSFVKRAFGGTGALFKPESADLELTVDMIEDIKANGLDTSTDPHGADFVYTDDSPESYPDIFDNAETGFSCEDALDIVAAMRCLAKGDDPSARIDTDELIRFFAVHNFILNYDSYSGTMLHNLVLCESEGTLSLVPWDYNLAFGAFVPIVGEDVLEDATDLVNRGIDSPLINTTEAERPLWSWIEGNAEYREQYHRMLGLMVAGITSGAFECEIDRLHDMLLPYVEQDPTAFFTADEFETGIETLKEFCLLRAESVQKQLAGELATYSLVQADADKVDASRIDMLAMGAAV